MIFKPWYSMRQVATHDIKIIILMSRGIFTKDAMLPKKINK